MQRGDVDLLRASEADSWLWGARMYASEYILRLGGKGK
jgi:hypothetical protein